MQHVSAARFNTWWQAESLPEPMAGTSIQCPDQPEVIYMVGGVTTGNQTSNRFYKYDAAQQAGWTRLPDLPIPLRGQAVACYQGRIYLAGGLVDVMDHLYIYKILNNGWFRGGRLTR